MSLVLQPTNQNINKACALNKYTHVCILLDNNCSLLTISNSRIIFYRGFYFNPLVIISVVCVPLLVLTPIVLLVHLKYRNRRSDQNNVQGHYHEINLYSEIHDDDLQDMTGTSTAIIEDFPTDNRFQHTNREHAYQNNAQSLPNINVISEQYLNPYCSLQHANDDYLNPYCALRFERRVKSCFL